MKHLSFALLALLLSLLFTPVGCETTQPSASPPREISDESATAAVRAESAASPAGADEDFWAIQEKRQDGSAQPAPRRTQARGVLSRWVNDRKSSQPLDVGKLRGDSPPPVEAGPELADEPEEDVPADPVNVEDGVEAEMTPEDDAPPEPATPGDESEAAPEAESSPESEADPDADADPEAPEQPDEADAGEPDAPEMESDEPPSDSPAETETPGEGAGEDPDQEPAPPQDGDLDELLKDLEDGDPK